MHLSLALVQLQQSEFEEALAAIKKEEEAQGKRNPVLDCIFGIVYTRMDQAKKAREILYDLMERSIELKISPCYLAA